MSVDVYSVSHPINLFSWTPIRLLMVWFIRTYTEQVCRNEALLATRGVQPLGTETLSQYCHRPFHFYLGYWLDMPAEKRALGTLWVSGNKPPVVQTFYLLKQPNHLWRKDPYSITFPSWVQSTVKAENHCHRIQLPQMKWTGQGS